MLMMRSRLRRPLICVMSAAILVGVIIQFRFVNWRSESLNAQEEAKRSKLDGADPDSRIQGEPSRIAEVQPARQNAVRLNDVNRSATVNDDQDAEFDRKAKQLAVRFRMAKPEEQAKLRQELETLNERHFEYRQQQRKQEIERLNGRVDSLRALQLRRQTHRAEILKRRLSDLIDPNLDLDWTGSEKSDDSASSRVGTAERESVSNLKPQDRAIDAIKQTEAAKSNSKPESLVLDEPSSSAQAGAKAADSNVTTSVGAATSIEKTFDGISYSQWLTMLETERKPEKLATAMEACTRLAEARDERRIARGVFLGAGLFESGDAKERDQVWNAGWTALKRLRADTVIDELIVALRDESSYKVGREFQGRLIAGKASASFAEIFKPRADDVISELVNVIQQNGKGADYLLAAASTAWQNSNRPLSDFDRLQPLMLKAIDDGPRVAISGMSEPVPVPWKIVAENVIQNAPETMDLALKLMKHASKSYEIVQLIGKMRRHAEPAVPLLVDLFLEEWKIVEAVQRERSVHSFSSYHPQLSHEDSYRHQFRREQIIRTLGEIGCGKHGSALLKQHILIARPIQEGDRPWCELVERAFRKFTPNEQWEGVPALLNDFSLINGHWTLRTLVPGQTPVSAVGHVRNSYLGLYDDNGGYAVIEQNYWSAFRSFSFQYELDATKNPKQISFFQLGPMPAAAGTKPREIPGTRHQGIYELTETTLRIQLAKPGEPRPSELVTDKLELPEGHLLLEFDRKMDDALTKANNPNDER